MSINIAGLGQSITKTNLEVAETIKYVDISLIKKNTRNFYKIEEEKVLSLAESIRINGLIEPLIVYLDNEEFTLISGHTRLEALIYLKEEKVPVKIVDAPNDGFEEQLLLIESNRQRTKTKKELQEEIKYLKKNYEELKKSNQRYKNINIQKLIAKDLGISKSTVIRNTEVSSDTLSKEKKIKTLESEKEKIIKNIKKLKDFNVDQEEVDQLILKLWEL